MLALLVVCGLGVLGALWHEQGATAPEAIVATTGLSKPVEDAQTSALSALNPEQAPWQARYRKYANVRQAHSFLSPMLEYASMDYLDRREAMGREGLESEEDYERMAALTMSHQALLYQSAYTQLEAAKKSPARDEALDAAIERWRLEAAKSERVWGELDDYWHQDRVYKRG